MTQLEKLKKSGAAPEWMTEEGLKTLQNGYLLPDETPLQMYRRVAEAAASYQKDSQGEWAVKFFDVMWKNWLCPASPVLSNMGTTRGLPISCNSIHVADNLIEENGILPKNVELGSLSKYGAGVGIYVGGIRPRGTIIKGNGFSEGIIPWCKIYDTTVSSVSQGNTRRGAAAVYAGIRHGDLEEFINMRRPTGDMNRRCMNMNHGLCVTDEFMESIKNGNVKDRAIWIEIIKARVETGQPYILFIDNANRANPECYVKNGLKVSTSNICTEIMLYTDPEHTFVCCLSSMNLVKWDEWKDTDAIEIATRFLDAVIEEYIRKARNIPTLANSVRSAEKGRAIGIGVLGWHTLLQSRMIPFDSFEAMMLNGQIFRTMRMKAEKASAELAAELGEPEWCKGFGRRNTHLMAVAPTVSNSAISGGHSAGIEPWAANVFSKKSAKGTFIVKNPQLEAHLAAIGKDTPEVWKSINEQSGSVQHLEFLTPREKEVFLTAREINQHAIIKQAAQRGKFIDQGQSVNLFFAANSDPKYIHEVHMAAWQEGLKSLYYLRTEGVIRGDLASRSKEECAACEG
jgi:ribonucleoside-diphosphate reductase alpha chain